MTTTTLPANMVSKIAMTRCPVAGLDGDCWDWTGAKTSRGYGSVNHDGRVWSTHRLAYVLLIGDVPDGLQLDHLCMRKTCCNPAHLEPVTGKVNCERTAAATKLRCVNGHPLLGPNLRIKNKVHGGTQRECRTCAYEAQSRRDDQRGRRRAISQAVLARRAQVLAESETELLKQLCVPNVAAWSNDQLAGGAA